MNYKAQRLWLWRLRSLLEAARNQNTEYSGYTESMVPDLDLWSAMDGINLAIKRAQKEADRALEAVNKHLWDFCERREFRMASFVNGQGRQIRVDSLYVTESYGGLLEGPRDGNYKEINETVIKRAQEFISSNWGERKTHLIPPEDLTKRLGQYLCIAWLNSFKPVKDSELDGSELVVIWFAHYDKLDFTENPLAGLPWEALAKDYGI